MLRFGFRIPLYIEKSVHSHKCPEQGLPSPIRRILCGCKRNRKLVLQQATAVRTFMGGLLFMSASSAKKLRWLCICAMMIALEIVLNRFCSINTAGIKIGFSFVPPMLTAMLYGPGSAALVYGLSDFLGALLFPIGQYHPGFTVCAAGMGLLLGLFLHKDHITFRHVLLPVLVNCLILGLFINTLWVSQLYGSKTYWGWFLYRLPEYAVLIPVQILCTPILKQLIHALRKAGLTEQSDRVGGK